MTGEVDRATLRRVAAMLWLALGPVQAGLAQAPEGVVQWSASVGAPSTVRHGAAATVNVSGEVLDGWHVYALAQPPGGPTALRVTLNENPVARLAGSPSGTAPEEKYDRSFDLKTRFYRHSFVLRVPIAVKPQADPGSQLIPIDIRFQSCSERECLPPKTIRLSVPIMVISDT